MLPTEAQWQYAAQGWDGRLYPWGNEWEPQRRNAEYRIGKTTHVIRCEGAGDSPFGVVDMAGNVWDWCLTDGGNQSNDVNSAASQRVLRGGSWFNDYLDAGAVCRYYGSPDSRDSRYGFRLVRALG